MSTAVKYDARRNPDTGIWFVAELVDDKAHLVAANLSETMARGIAQAMNNCRQDIDLLAAIQDARERLAAGRTVGGDWRRAAVEAEGILADALGITK